MESLNTEQSSSSMDDELVIEGSPGGPYMVEKIVGIYMGKDKKKYYRVKWIDSWEPEDNLSEACQKLIDDFWNGTTLDQKGSFVKKSELKQGLRVIKKEMVQSPSEKEATSSTLPTTFSTNENNNNQTTAEQAKTTSSAPIIKKDPTLAVPSTTKPDTEKNKTTVKDLPEKVKQKGQNLDSDNKILHSPSNTGVVKQPVVTDNTPTTLKSSHSRISPHKQTSEKQCVQQPQHAVVEYAAVAPQNSPVKVDNVKKHNTLYSTPPPMISDDDCDLPTDSSEYSCETSHVSHEYSNESVIGNSLSSLRDLNDSANKSEKIIDIVQSDEEECEITVSIQSPATKQKQKQTRGRKTTENVIMSKRKTSTNSVTNQTVNQVSPSALPMHPRSMLQNIATDSSQEIVPAMSPVMSPAKRMRRDLSCPAKIPSLERNARNSTTISGRTLFQKQTETHTPTRRLNQVPQLQTSPSTHTSQAQRSNSVDTNENRICKICKQSFPNITLTRQHMRLKHSSQSDSSISPTTPTVTLSPEVTLLPCTVCTGLFRTKTDLQSHMLLHGTHSIYKCEICSECFHQRLLLNQHMVRMHSNEVPFPCSVCNKRFRQQSHLTLHMAKHRQQQQQQANITCPHCCIDFTEVTEFTQHKCKGNGSATVDTPFCCKICQERFKYKTDMLKHLEVHKSVLN